MLDCQKRAYETWISKPENKEKKRAITLAWRQANRERCRLKKALYRANNRESYRNYNTTRRARERNAKGSHTVGQWLARVEYYGWLCAYCKIPLSTATLTKDHVIPLSQGGPNWAANLVPSCSMCNNKKHHLRWVPSIRSK